MHKEQDEQPAEDERSSAGSLGIPLWATQKSALPRLKEKTTRLRHAIDARIENSPNTRVKLRLLKVRQLFGLTAEEVDIFLICLIREFDASYQGIWAEIQDSRSKKYPLIETILNLLSFNLAEKLKMRNYLQDGSKLFRYNLLEPVDANSHSGGFTLEHEIK